SAIPSLPNSPHSGLSATGTPCTSRSWRTESLVSSEPSTLLPAVDSTSATGGSISWNTDSRRDRPFALGVRHPRSSTRLCIPVGGELLQRSRYLHSTQPGRNFCSGRNEISVKSPGRREAGTRTPGVPAFRAQFDHG